MNAKHIEQLTRESEELAQVGTWVVEHDTGRLTWSEGLFHLLGVEAATVADLAMRLHGTWKLESRIVSDSMTEQGGIAHRITIYDITEITSTAAFGTVSGIESGILHPFVEEPPFGTNQPFALGGCFG